MKEAHDSENSALFLELIVYTSQITIIPSLMHSYTNYGYLYVLLAVCKM